MLVGILVSAGGAAGQVPPITTPPDSTVPTTPPPPKDEPPPVPSPSEPPPTVAPGGPSTPAPPGTPVTTAPAAPPAPTTSTTTAAAGALPPPKAVGASSGGLSLDLSRIDTLRRQARGKGPRTAEPDFGFDSSLPFQDGEGGGAGEASEEALELGAEEEKIAQVRAAGSVAAGLMALLLVGLAAWVLRQARSAAHAIPN